LELWEFIIVTEPDVLLRLGAICDHGSFIKNAAACIVVVCRETKYYLEDGSAATMNILLSAADLNLGACWVAGDKKEYQNEILRLLNVPNEFKLASLISLGWPKIEPHQNKKRGLKEVAHWEKF
jgi:nitroreductase